MKNKLNALLIIQVLLILILLWLLTYFGRDEFNNSNINKHISNTTQPLIQPENGINYIALNSEVQLNSGIKTLPIQKSKLKIQKFENRCLGKITFYFLLFTFYFLLFKIGRAHV